MKLDFSHKLSYHHRVEPLLPVSLTIGAYQADMLLLLDTGASDTLMDGVHLRAAGLDLFSGEPRSFQGFLGARTLAYRHRVRLELVDLELDIVVAFSTQPLSRQVLGRDLMAHLLVGLRERAQELYIGPNPVD